MTDAREPREDASPTPDADTPERRPRRGPSPSRRPRKIYLPWWVLTALGALVGFATASWPGLIIGGVLGFFAWKLR